MVQELYDRAPALFEPVLPRSEIESLNIDPEEDEILLQSDQAHLRATALGCIQSSYVRNQLGFPVTTKDMENKSNAAFVAQFAAAYSRDYAKPNVVHFGKVPLQWSKKLSYYDKLVC